MLAFILSLSFIASLALAVTARARQTQSSESAALVGKVIDPSGAAISNAPVEITNSSDSYHRSVRTNSGGYFEALRLPPGSYAIRLRFPGFKTMLREGVRLATPSPTALGPGNSARSSVAGRVPENPRTPSSSSPAAALAAYSRAISLAALFCEETLSTPSK